MSVLSIQTRRIDGLTEATTAEDEDLLLIRKADGTGTRNIKKKNLIPKTVDKVGDLNELTTADKTSVVKAVNEIRKRGDDRARDATTRVFNVETKVGHLNELVGYVVQDNAASHNNIYREKNLGYSFTSTQRQGIKDGTFKDLYIGDYFIFGDSRLYVAHFDYFLTTNFSATPAHHVVLVPSCILSFSEFSNEGERYGKSILRKTIESLTIRGTMGDLPNVRDVNVDIWYDFSQKGNLSAAYNAVNCNTGALTSQMVIGQNLICRYEEINYYLPSFQQMALFRHNPSLIRSNADWWLADSVSIGEAITVDKYGTFYKKITSQRTGVRPFFVITAA